MGSVPGPGRSPGEGNGNPLQCSCLENPLDRRAWHRVGHDWTTEHTCTHPCTKLKIERYKTVNCYDDYDLWQEPSSFLESKCYVFSSPPITSARRPGESSNTQFLVFSRFTTWGRNWISWWTCICSIWSGSRCTSPASPRARGPPRPPRPSRRRTAGMRIWKPSSVTIPKREPRCPLQLPPGARRQSRPLWVFCPRPREPAPRGTQFWKGSCDPLCGKAHRPAYLDASRLPRELPLPGRTARPLFGPSLPPAKAQHHPGQRHAPVPDVSQPRGAGTLAQWLQHLPGQRRLCVWPERGIELDEGEAVPGRGWDGHGHGALHTQWLPASVVHGGRHFWFDMDPFRQAHLKKGSWAGSSL